MVEFSLVENFAEGKAGFGPHFVEVWQGKATSRRDGTLFVTLFAAPFIWTGERMRVEEFAKHVAQHASNLSNIGHWEIELSYDSDKHRWVARAKHENEDGTEGVTRRYTEWASN